MEIDQNLEGEHADVDINALLASINSNLEEGLLGSQKDLGVEENCKNDSPNKIQSPEKKPSSPLKENAISGNSKSEEKQGDQKNTETQKSNVFTIVRDAPEIIEEIDPLLKTLEKIKIVIFLVIFKNVSFKRPTVF